MNQELQPTWDLDALYPGGSHSQELQQTLGELERDMAALTNELQGEDVDDWTSLLHNLQSVEQRLSNVVAFVHCLTAQNVKDEQAKLLMGDVRQLGAAYESLMTLFDQHLQAIPTDDWEKLLNQDDVRLLAFNLEERRARAKDKLPPEQERLVNDLSIDGYHAWDELYNTIVGGMTIPFEEEGTTVDLSVGQAHNKLYSEDRDTRERMMEKWEKAWQENAELCGTALNRLAGYRLNLYRHRGWDDVLREPLEINRMRAETLETMWDVIDRNKDIFVTYLKRKAKLLGVDALSWHDVDAPFGTSARKVTYDEAARFIVRQFRRFSPKMADFAEMAFARRWIEAEDRADKRPGGFCTSFPVHKETRIFMTFEGSQDNVATLAHELGHAYHQHVMRDMPQFTQNYAMNVAETASTFAEMIVADAAVAQAETADERIALLDAKVRRGIAFFMNLHSRFLFETRFYERRKKGLVSVKELNELMVNAQKDAFKDSLGAYHPHFWASKLHFYATDVPFYNFPYTFGYLFSYGVYAQAKKEGQAFEDKYVRLLRDTGRMRVEDLAARHLGVDMTQPAFWQRSVDLTIEDAEAFLALTD